MSNRCFCSLPCTFPARVDARCFPVFVRSAHHMATANLFYHPRLPCPQNFFLGILDSAPLLLPQRHALNASLVALSASGLLGMLALGPESYSTGLAVILGGAAAAGGISGLTLTAAIGGTS